MLVFLTRASNGCNNEILNERKKLSNNRKLVSINTFDFEKLYTNIDHKNLIEALKAVIKRAFGYNRKFVSCGEFSTLPTVLTRAPGWKPPRGVPGSQPVPNQTYKVEPIKIRTL